MGDSQIFGPRPEHGSVRKPTAHEREEYHDFLEKLMSSAFFVDLPEDTQQAVIVVRDTLCWTLGHPNESFAANMRSWAIYYKNQRNLNDTFYN